MTGQVLITVDTEALPARAETAHVERLIWGRFETGRAGIKEMVSISEDLGVPFLFFLEIAGMVHSPAEMREVAAFLYRAGQDVELHFHPEILGKAFWRKMGIELASLRQDLFSESEAIGTLRWAHKTFQAVVGTQPRAYRAGSFRWNKHTIAALGHCGISYSFNSCRETSEKPNYQTMAADSSNVFRWPNGVVEVPCGEGWYGPDLLHLRYPRRLPERVAFMDVVRRVVDELDEASVAVIVLHSWSFLQRDQKTGYYRYSGTEAVDRFHKLVDAIHREFGLVSFSELRARLRGVALAERNLE